MESLLVKSKLMSRSDPELEPNSSSPLYEQLSQSIRASIFSEQLSENEKLPSEQELCQQYKVSRITVRRAVKELVDEGILERRQGKGTFVAKPKVSLHAMALDGFYRLTSEKKNNAKVQVIRKESRPAKTKEAQLLGLESGASVYALTRLLMIGADPIMLDTSVYDSKRFPGILDFVQDNVSTYDLMSSLYHRENHSVEKEINITMARPDESELLRCKTGEVLFYVEKVVLDDKHEANHCSFGLVVASRVKLTLKYSREIRNADEKREITM